MAKDDTTGRKTPFLNKWAFRLWWLPRILVLPFTIPVAVVLGVLAGLGSRSAEAAAGAMFAMLDRWLTEMKADVERLSRPIDKEGP